MSVHTVHSNTPSIHCLAGCDVGIEYVYSMRGVEVFSGSCYVKSIDNNRDYIYNKPLFLLIIHDLS